ncbi:MAG: UDP-glucose 6-dehydrogenase [Burkholderiales bacterium RIFCSPLOWO2_02_FULL_57_36]|nr:MAG: UDP-glucose 6-dehydrogenase [Burkholderiales bacterium RIFCSPLOWO2_02_FULL_57_36]
MKITVFGTGYVGLVTGACLADVGHNVICMDVDGTKIGNLKQGAIPIYEPGLEQLVRRNHTEGRLHFTTDPAAAAGFGTLQFIAVGTPLDEDGSADLQYVLTVAAMIGEHMDEYRLVVDKSTVPVGTAERVRAVIAEKLHRRGVDHPFEVCSNPEFLKEGSAIEDFTRGPRIMVGTDSQHVRDLMSECYAPYNRNRDKLIFMDVRAAELTKYAANAMLAARISFMNELANVAERLGVDIEQVRQGIGSDPRIGYHFIYPGCGYGGSCFPKDIKALVRTAEQVDVETQLLNVVEAVNNRQKNILFRKLNRALRGELAGCTIAVWGLAFKPNTNDMREAPSRSLMESLWKAGAKVNAYDPEAMDEARRLYGERDDLTLSDSREAAVAGADALVICTEWKQFRSVDFNWLYRELRQPVIVDGRNLYNPAEVQQHGFLYYAIGRGDSLR